MIKFKSHDPKLLPVYKTSLSAGADIRASEETIVYPKQIAKVRTGVFLDIVEENSPEPGSFFIPEIQVRIRSSLAYNYNLILANGVGTIDIDYPDEICVLLRNLGDAPVVLEKYDRIAQLVASGTIRMQLEAGGKRTGGFGSTGKR